MPKISTFIYCDRAEPNQQGQLTLTGPLLAINPIYVPGLFSFSIAFGVLDIINDTDHTLRILFLNDSNEVIIDSNVIPLPKGQAPKINIIGLPDEHKGFMFNMDFRNIIFQTEGVYKTQVIVDDEMLGEFPIFVKAGEAQ